MTIAEQVLDLLTYSGPLAQVDIAYRIYQNQASVRRTCQGLQRAGKIHVADYNGYRSTPQLAIGPKPLAVAAEEVVGF